MGAWGDPNHDERGGRPPSQNNLFVVHMPTATTPFLGPEPAPTLDARVRAALACASASLSPASPPGDPRRHYQILRRAAGDSYMAPDDWLAAAPEVQGSWWPAWQQWLAAHAGQAAAYRRFCTPPGRRRAGQLRAEEVGMPLTPRGKKPWARILGAAAALLLVSCTSMAPVFEAPLLPVASQYPLDAPHAEAGVRAAGLGWREHFTDPRLLQLIAQALANNRDLRIAALRVQEARAAYGIQRADRLPTVGLAADGARSLVPGDLNISGQPVTAGQYQVGLGASAWELDVWGRVRSLQDAALQNFLATDAARRAVTLALVAQVADGYLSLRELDERVALARRSIASREESLRIFTRRFEVGATSKLDLTQVQTLLAQAQSLGVQLEQARAAQAHALSQLIGSPVDLAPTREHFDDSTVVQELRAGLPSELLIDRPDILAAEHRLRAANANIGAARAAFFPRVTLTGSFGTASAELDGLFESGSRAWTFAPSISLPIFDGGRNRANLNLTEVRRELAVADYEKTVQTAFREVSDALSARQWLAEQVRIQQSNLAAQSERARLAKLRYDNGAATFLEVLDAQRDLLSTEQQLVQARRALLSARVALYAALGGGTQTPAGESAVTG